MHCRAEEHALHQLAEQTWDIQRLKEYTCAICTVNLNLPELEETSEEHKTDPPGRVIRPDTVLQAIIKHFLVESGWPATIVNAMMENAHKRSWPPGSGHTRDEMDEPQLLWKKKKKCEQEEHPWWANYGADGCENQHGVQKQGLVMIFRQGMQEIRECNWLPEVVESAKPLTPAAEPWALPSILTPWLVTEPHPSCFSDRKDLGTADAPHP